MAVLTAAVEMAKVAVCDPEGIRTVLPLGNVALGLLLLNVTSAALFGAGPPNETVPIADDPPSTSVALVVS